MKFYLLEIQDRKFLRDSIIKKIAIQAANESHAKTIYKTVHKKKIIFLSVDVISFTEYLEYCRK